MAVVQYGGSFATVYAYTIVYTTFYMATWEEYYIGGLFLPCFNGVNEGQMIAVGGFIFTAIVGTKFWLGTFLGITLNKLVLVGFTLSWI